MKLKGLDWDKLLLKISQYSSCSQSKDAILSIEPYAHFALAQKNMDMIADFKSLFKKDSKRVKLDSFESIESVLYSLKKGQTLNISDLNIVRLFLEDLKALNQLYPWNEFDKILSLIQRVINPKIFLDRISGLVTPSGEFRSDASPLLFESFNKKKGLFKQIHQTLDKLVKDHALESVLQDKYVTTREGRWVIPVISGQRHNFKGLIHDSSNSKQTVYMEPEEVIHLNNKVRELEDIINKEIERILKEISSLLSEKHPQLYKSYEAAIEIDKLTAVALWSIDYQAERIKLTKEKTINLKQVFHPLLIDENKHVTKNDFELKQDESILLLSGPNAGGKTVLLKSVGLASQMARCGLPICAHHESTLPFFLEIHVLIGDHQSVESSLSTFAAHLKALNSFSQLKSADNLLLVDEICGSTEASEGAALARAFIEKFAKNNIKAFITSHLGALKTGWEKESKIINGSMYFDTKKGVPTYEFIKGVPGDSLAIETAKKVGVDQKLVDRALYFLTPEQRKKYSGLTEIENLQQALHTQKQVLQKKQTELDELKLEYQTMIAEFKKEQEDLLELSLKRAQAKMKKSSPSYKSIDDIFKNKEHLDKMRSSFPNLIKTSKETSSQEITEKNFSTKLPPGTPVYIPSLKKNGVVQGTVNNKGFVPVMSDSMRILIQWSDARPISKQENSNKKNFYSKDVLEGKTENQVDLRGLDVESSLQELENAIDKSLRLNCDRLKVIHGHGTEKLKKNVRNFLSRHPLVKTWKVDQDDGVTQALF